MVMVLCMAPLSITIVPSPFQATVKPSGSATFTRGTMTGRATSAISPSTSSW